MAKYKVGDQVIIKSIEWYNENKNAVQEVVSKDRNTFVSDMLTYCGKNATIVNVTNYGDYQLDIDEGFWGWSDFMLLDYTKEYKVGDKVRIKSKEWFDSQYKSNREDIEPPEEYNRPFFDFMEQYCGNICTIKYIYSNNVIKFNENDEAWESWMFDLVDEDKIEVGDLVTNKDKIQYVIVENLSESNYYYALDVEHWNAAAINKKENLIIVEKGKYKDLINTKLPLETRARQLRNRFGIIAKSEDMRKELKNGTKKHFIREPRIGDTIKSTYFNGIIIGENNDKSAFLILTTPYFYKQWLYKDSITEIDGYGRYLYDIDTNECDLDIRADKFRKYFMSSDYYTEKVTTSEEQLSNNKDNDSQSNSSKFDLSRVIYRSRRIK